MKKKGWVLFLLSLVILPGCWDRVDLEDVAIVAGVGIDKKEDKFQVTTQTIKPGEVKKSSKQTVLIRSSEGITIFEAVRNFIITRGKKQIWHHIDALIISEEMAREGVKPVIDFFSRDHEPRFRMNLFISKGTAKEILEIKSEAGPIPSISMKKALTEHKALSKAPIVEFHNFIERLMEPYQDAYLPYIHKGTQDFEIFGTAVFRRDRLVGELTPKETRAMLRALGELKGGIQVISYPSGEREEANYISIEIKQSASSMEARFKNGKPTIIIEIEETGFLGDMSQPIELNDEVFKEMEQVYADTIEKEVRRTVNKIQKDYKSNIFPFAGVIKRTDKQYWKEHQKHWEELYPELVVDIRVKTHIPQNGLITKHNGK